MTHVTICFTHAEKIVIRACDCQDAEAWALLSDHIDLMEIESVSEGNKKTFTFDDGSKLVIVGIDYYSIKAYPAEAGKVVH